MKKIQETIQYIEGLERFGSVLGLENIRTLMKLLGDPQKKLKTIHIAGTNGKGSVSTMTAAILQKAGYRVGLYTSPYLVDFGERIRVNHTPIPDNDLIRLTEKIKNASQKMLAAGIAHPTCFEFKTALALLYFAEQNCDFSVLEVGMGGRLDATNVIPSPEVAVITPISLDHTQILGDTIEKIAKEKAGIIKAGSYLVSAPQKKSVSQILQEKAALCGIPYVEVDSKWVTTTRSDASGHICDYHRPEGIPDLESFTLNLPGQFQISNVNTVLEVIHTLIKKGYKISAQSIGQALSTVVFPGRFETLSLKPYVIIDGAHNPAGIASLKENIATYFQDKKINLFIGMLADKDILSSMASLLPLADTIYTLTPDNTRAMTASDLSDLIENHFNRKACPCETIAQALEKLAYDSDSVNIFTGSLYLIGKVRTEILKFCIKKSQAK